MRRCPGERLRNITVSLKERLGSYTKLSWKSTRFFLLAFLLSRITTVVLAVLQEVPHPLTSTAPH